jgi:VWFA-related protein
MMNRIRPFISNAAGKGSTCNLRIWLLIGAFSLQAQTPTPAEVRIRSGPYAFPQTTISVQANLVESGVSVRNGRGVPVGGFTVSDFEILDNGKPQAITFFFVQGNNRTTAAQATQAAGGPAGGSTPAVQIPPAPRSLALFFDDTHASMADCHRAVLASEKVLAEQPMDRIALFTGSGSVTEDFTTDREKLRAALAKIKPHWTRNQLDTCVTMDQYQAYAIDNHLDPSEKTRAVSLAI